MNGDTNNKTHARNHSLSAPHILVVEDQATTRKIVLQLLEKNGYQVTGVASGQEAIERIENNHFDLVLLDILMPGMNGFEVLDGVRKRYSLYELPVIMVSVRDANEDIIQALSMGANDYIIKPVDFPVLCARLKTHLLQKTIPESQFQSLIEHSHDIIAMFEEDGTAVYESPSLTRILGYLPEQRIGKNILELVHPDDQKIVAEKFALAFATPGAVISQAARIRHRDGNYRMLEAIGSTTLSFDGRRRGVVNARDVTDRYQLSEQLTFQETHDSLTGFINRREFERQLVALLDRRRINYSDSAMIHLDLDQFKVINEACGHIAGDDLLRQVSRLLYNMVRTHDVLARLGGNEFGVLLESCGLEHAGRIAEKIHKGINSFQFQWDNTKYPMSASIGLVSITSGSQNYNDILIHAEAACKMAKDSGRNRIHIYHEDDTGMAQRQGEIRWVAEINRAFNQNRFCLFAQSIHPVAPVADTGSRFELLLRMRSENKELIPPGAFLGAAERYHLSTRLDMWVIETTFRTLLMSPEKTGKLSHVAINVSGLSLVDANFLDFIVKLYKQAAVPPGRVCFEITETAAIANLSSAMIFINTLRDLGCHFSLDDFGSGLSSFAYLKNLPVDFLKIDGAFVKNIHHDPIDLAMVKSINDIGHEMGKLTIAEFVENETILEILKDIGVDYAQGYHIGRPRPLEEMI